MVERAEEAGYGDQERLEGETGEPLYMKRIRKLFKEAAEIRTGTEEIETQFREMKEEDRSEKAGMWRVIDEFEGVGQKLEEAKALAVRENEHRKDYSRERGRVDEEREPLKLRELKILNENEGREGIQTSNL